MYARVQSDAATDSLAMMVVPDTFRNGDSSVAHNPPTTSHAWSLARSLLAVLALFASTLLALAQLPSSLAPYANKVGASEGSYSVISKRGCVGRYQFCPGTLQQYTSESPQQFANDPAAQDAAFLQYEKDQNALATKNGYFNAVGSQVCATDKFGTKCGTLTDSSILYACQFGCASSGKLGAYLAAGSQCSSKLLYPNKPGNLATTTNDSNGVCAGDYALRGSGLNVSAITNRSPTTPTTPTTTTLPPAPAKAPAAPSPAKPPATTPPATTPPATTQPAPGSLQTNAVGSAPTGTPTGTVGTVPPQQPGITLNLSTYNPGDQSGTQEFTVGDPTTCWICNAAQYALGVVDAVGSSGAPLIVVLIRPLVLILASIALCLTIGRALIVGSDVYKPTFAFVGRLALLTAVFAAGSIPPLGGSNASGASGGSILFDYVLSPPINLGASLGSDLADVASSSLGVTIPAGNCSYVDAATAGIKDLTDASASLMKLLCKIHVAASTGIDLGAQVSIHSGDKATQLDQATALVVSFMGFTVMALSTLAMLNFAFAVLEVILKVGLVAAFFPLICFCWLFETTRGSVRVLADSMLFSVIYLSLCGLSSVVAVYVMMEGFSFGLGQNGATVSSAGLLQQFDVVASSLNLDTGNGLTQVTLLVGYSLAGTLMSVRLLRASHELAVDLSGFALARSGAISQVGSRLVSLAAGTGSAGAGLFAAVGGRVAGAAAGGVAGGLKPLARAGARR